MSILARVLQERATRPAVIPERFRDFMTFCGVPPSPVIAAIADASEGKRVELDDALCTSTFGCCAADLPFEPRRAVVVRAGGRAGKTSRLLATKAIHAALTVPLPTLAAGEHARAVIIAPDKDLAVQALSFVRGYVGAIPALRKLVVEARVSDEEDAPGTTERVTLRRPCDGKLVDIRIGAATRGAKAVRGKTLVFVGLDEAAFFYADDHYTVTDAEIYRAAVQRVAPGGQLWIVSTPWIEGYGVMEERIARDWGKHEASLVAMGGTRALNPTWDPTGEIERDMRATDPDNAAREIDAIGLPAGTKLFFSPESIQNSVNRSRPMHLEHVAGATHYAGSDLGFRKNSSAIAIARRNGKVELAYHEELRPSRYEPLKPSVVCQAFAKTCREYGVDTVRGDLHYAETAREEMGKHNVHYEAWNPSVEEQTAAFTALRTLMGEGQFEMPDDPRLLGMFRKVASMPVPGGKVKVVLPKQGAAHGDVLMAVALAVMQVPAEEFRYESFRVRSQRGR
jgi:hypothetical protein